ncbi:hypothetical protein [Phytoactinopolyspora halotolerans]|uniref:Transglycosylase SLT domain-containing protein n=1 Tax=Phytoactinopolyspora halotolerans TaxID=1981512 RepID=A0A6L9S7V1_9ACTN|nr:hypothetical protein [Phytoactinopolyspora halotolerans]NEE01545.1 hypothetical protein [Phytoactinopolyspora halotolerans]
MTRQIPRPLLCLLITAATAAMTTLPAAPSPDAAAVGSAGVDHTFADTASPEESAEDLKLANAWVPADQELRFGAKPLEFAREAAAAEAADADCNISAQAATALLIAMTWPEVSPSGAAPSPMTLSRYDTQPTLADPQNRAPGLWFHPGIGMWQLDSAGLGTNFTAAEAMDTKGAANRLAPYVVHRYCTAINRGDTRKEARAYAWTAWVACRQGACENTFQRALNGVTPVDGIGRYGGAKPRRCWYQGAAHDCFYVDPANAQGASWWAAPGGGRSPVAAPFYVIRLDGSATVELRYWLAADSGASTDVQARRPFGANARTGLTWARGPGLCDLTAQRGAC